MQVRLFPSLPQLLHDHGHTQGEESQGSGAYEAGGFGFMEDDAILSSVATSRRQSRHALCQLLFSAEQAKSDRERLPPSPIIQDCVSQRSGVMGNFSKKAVHATSNRDNILDLVSIHSQDRL